VPILYPNPGFPIYERHKVFQGDTGAFTRAPGSRSVPRRCWKITPRTRLLIINGPANPTASPRAELDRLVAGLERHPRSR
jgi:aspartate/methionine/tyrosine aminotransferase